jgi:transketolase
MTQSPQATPDAFADAVQTVRFLAVDAVEKANSGHPGAPMSLAGIAVELFSRHLRYVPEAPDWPNRDRFVLSCGHASMLLYAILHLAGYGVTLDDIKNFRQWDSRTPGHPEHGLTPGVETTTGPLGQGFGNAVGMALASKLLASRLNQPGSAVIDYRVFVLASDGDVMEGVCYESASLAGHLKLDNLIVFYDDNRITIDGPTELTFSEDVGVRFEASGWYVQRIDGLDPAQVRAALERAQAVSGQPKLIVAKTRIAIGAPTKAGTAESHGAALGAKEVEATKRAAGWPLEPTFYVADRAREPFVARAEQNRSEYRAWLSTVAALGGEQAELWRRLSTRSVPQDIFDQLLKVAAPKADATRNHAGKIQQRVAELVPSLLGGSADLAGSAKTTIEKSTDVRRGDFAGRNLHFGVREHAMGAVINGLSLSGAFIPYGSTFLIFSDYMRPAIRLAALMERQVVFVYSHDSVFLGEDGPTHQPIEQIWSLRLIPNLHVYRPADAMECAAAWTHALTRTQAPTALVLSRQKIPAIERAPGFDPRSLLDGAYVLTDVDSPELVLIATGSELHVAVEASRILAKGGRRIRVVSAPCLEAFAALPKARQDRILPPGVRRASIEAGRTTPWRSLVGTDGITIGIDRFGASAPWEVIAEKLGLIAQTVASRLMAELAG